MELTLYNLAKEVAEKALNEITYEGKTIREWVEIIVKQQPCEDCISREAVEKITWEEPSYDDALNVLTEVRDKVRALPSVTPSRPKGHWILIHPLQEDDDGAYICSNCEHGDWDCDTSYKYCPFCGVDMREVRENDR